jgi:hypothetical protein
MNNELQETLQELGQGKKGGALTRRAKGDNKQRVTESK